MTCVLCPPVIEFNGAFNLNVLLLGSLVFADKVIDHIGDKTAGYLVSLLSAQAVIVHQLAGKMSDHHIDHRVIHQTLAIAALFEHKPIYFQGLRRPYFVTQRYRVGKLPLLPHYFVRLEHGLLITESLADPFTRLNNSSSIIFLRLNVLKVQG